jgi:potassium-transporting ATPase KdpC subunit
MSSSIWFKEIVMKMIRAALVSFVLLTVLTGVLYPLAVTAIAKTCFANQAEGSLIDKDGHATLDEKAAVGSSLIGQTFDQPQYFWSRPSATSPQAYNASASSGSNAGPSAIAPTIQGRVDALHQADPANKKDVPVDLVTASGSGLDPQESVAAAEYQVSRVAAVRKADPAGLNALIAAHTAEPDLGMFGERVVNVVALNLALDKAYPYVAPTTAASQASTASKP